MSFIQSLLQPILDHPAFQAAVEFAETDSGQAADGISISGLIPPAKGIAVGVLAHKLNRPVIVITADNDAVESLARTASTVLDWFEPGTACTALALPEFDSLPYEARSPHPDILEQRAVGLW